MVDGKKQERARSKISRRNKTGVTGVSRVKDSQRFRANLMVDGINFRLGTFPTVEDAAIARKTAEDRVRKGLSPQIEKCVHNKTISCRNKTGVIGVSQIKDSQKFVANIKVNKINYHLGTFLTIEEATQARYTAEKRVRNGLSLQDQITDGRTAVNRKPSKCNKTGVTGVSYIEARQRFTATIKVNRQHFYLGCFLTIEEATHARKMAEEQVRQGLSPQIQPSSTSDGRKAINRKPSKCNKTGVTGVSYIEARQRFTATIKVNRQHFYLGCFLTIEEATHARKMAEEQVRQGLSPQIQPSSTSDGRVRQGLSPQIQPSSTSDGRKAVNRKPSQCNNTGVTGVRYIKAKKKFKVAIQVSGERFHLGCFLTIEEATHARKMAEEQVRQGLSPQIQPSSTSDGRKAINRKPSRCNNTGVAGVAYIKARQKFRATITVNGKNIHLGLFPTVEEAVQARKMAEERVRNGLPPKEKGEQLHE